MKLSWDSIALWLHLGGGATIWCCRCGKWPDRFVRALYVL